jgi:hypothetical protein
MELSLSVGILLLCVDLPFPCRSVALPFGSFEAVLADPANADLAAELSAIQKQLEAVVAAKGGSATPLSGSSNGNGNGNGNGAAVRNGTAAAAAVAAAASSESVSPVTLLTAARELVQNQLKPPAGAQQVCCWQCAPCCLVPV